MYLHGKEHRYTWRQAKLRYEVRPETGNDSYEDREIDPEERVDHVESVAFTIGGTLMFYGLF